jgi:hypothetical protein
VKVSQARCRHSRWHRGVHVPNSGTPMLPFYVCVQASFPWAASSSLCDSSDFASQTASRSSRRGGGGFFSPLLPSSPLLPPWRWRTGEGENPKVVGERVAGGSVQGIGARSKLGKGKDAVLGTARALTWLRPCGWRCFFWSGREG